MSVREVIELGDKKLKQVNASIADFQDPQLKQLIKDLIDTMYEKDLIGIAAPQIGENFKVFITEPRQTATRTADQSDKLRIYINPELVESSIDECIIYEGCGCMPSQSIFGPVSRPKVVKVKAQDENGRWFEFTADGILGRVIQHEYDHLQGIEFIQKVVNNSEFMGYQHYIAQVKSQAWHQENSVIHIKEFKYLD